MRLKSRECRLREVEDQNARNDGQSGIGRMLRINRWGTDTGRMVSEAKIKKVERSEKQLENSIFAGSRADAVRRSLFVNVLGIMNVL